MIEKRNMIVRLLNSATISTPRVNLREVFTHATAGMSTVATVRTRKMLFVWNYF